jgi:type IV pilus assembly protein PilA
MIVVAIIGVLASIAIPQYQNYTARAQASEALTITSGVRTDIAEKYSLTGSMPGENDVDTTDMSGRYVDTVSYADSAISVTFKEDSAIGTKVMNIAPVDNNGVSPGNGWTCAWSVGSGDANESWLPSGCKAADDGN